MQTFQSQSNFRSLHIVSLSEKKEKKKNHSTCQVAAKEEKLSQRQSHDPTELVCSSQSVVFIVCCAKATMQSASVPEPQFTWLPSWNIWPLKFSSWLVMLPVI